MPWLLLVVVAAGAGLGVLVWWPASQAVPTLEVIGRSTPVATTAASVPTSSAAATDFSVQQPSPGPVLPFGSGSSQEDLATLPIFPSRDEQAFDASASRVPAPAKETPGEVGRSSGQEAGAPEGRTAQGPSSQLIGLPTSVAGSAPGADSAASRAPEIVIEVPAGQKVPAVFYEAEPKPVPQQKMLDRIATEFNETVANPPPGVPEQQLWEDARRRADEQYLKLYGHAAYNARHLQAAREAAREKRALEAAVRPQGDAAVAAPGAP